MPYSIATVPEAAGPQLKPVGDYVGQLLVSPFAARGRRIRLDPACPPYRGLYIIPPGHWPARYKPYWWTAYGSLTRRSRLRKNSHCLLPASSCTGLPASLKQYGRSYAIHWRLVGPKNIRRVAVEPVRTQI